MKIQWIVSRFHRGEGGAVAMLALAATLIILLSALVVIDATGVTSSNIHVQHTTDVSAYSQATIQARSMNMVAYTNVGKRMTVGMVNTYININQWLLNIRMMSEYAAAFVCVGSIVIPALVSMCNQMVQAAVGARQLYSWESRDRGRIYSKSRRCMIRVLGRCVSRWPARTEWGAPDYRWLPYPLNSLVNLPLPSDIMRWRSRSLTNRFFARELRAFDNYQRYMIAITPFWSWTEGIARGVYNQAPITVGYPPPPFNQNQDHANTLPVRRGEWRDTCDRARDSFDRNWYAADVVLKSGIAIAEGRNSGGGGTMRASRPIALALATASSTQIDRNHIPRPADAILARTWWENCMGRGRRSDNSAALRVWNNAGAGTHGRPFVLETGNSEAQWQLRTSTLMFGFRPNASIMDDDGMRGNYRMLNDYNANSPRAGGTWSIARSEFAFQSNSRPNLWEPRWTARMRPVALPGEWSDLNDFHLADAFDRSAATLATVTTVTHALDAGFGLGLIEHGHSLSGGNAFSQLVDEVLAIRLAVEGLNSDRIEGLPK